MYISKDQSIDCNSREYRNAIPFAIIMIFIYPIGTPLMYHLLLRKHRHTLSNPSAMDREDKHNNPKTGRE